MTADTDPRTKFVEWNGSLNALVFRNTAVPVADLWELLRQGRTFNDFLHQHPRVSTLHVIGVLRIAGDYLCDWPIDREERKAAYQKAIEERDVRFTTGALKYSPHIRGGRLVCGGDRHNRPTVVWENLEGGASIADVNEWYGITLDVMSSIITAAAALFEKGLVPGENLPGRGRKPAAETTH